jgi:hypothetical protein
MKKICVTGITIVCLAVMVNAVNISLSGTLKKDGGTPVAGAIVSTVFFQSKKMADKISDTTDSQGKFDIKATNVSVRRAGWAASPVCRFSVKNSAIVFAPSLGTVSGKVELYAADGACLFSFPFDNLAAGKQGIALPRLAAGITLLRVSIAGTSYTQNVVRMGNLVYSQAGASPVRTEQGVAKKTAIIDTLVAYKQNFIDRKVPLDSYTKANMVDSMSGGILKKLFAISNGMIPGWKMIRSTLDSSFTLWSAADLYKDIDGGFERYTDHGMLQAADIGMLGPINSEGNPFELSIHSFIMDYGTEPIAKAMYDFSKSQYFGDDALPIPSYENTAAFAKPALGGITVYAYYKQFYFELILSAYPDDANPTADAKLFLDYFKTKAN